MNNVKLTISGAAKTGKTTVLRYVAEKLKEAGCEVVIVPVEGDEMQPGYRAETLKTVKVKMSEHGMREEWPNDPKLSDSGP